MDITLLADAEAFRREAQPFATGAVSFEAAKAGIPNRSRGGFPATAKLVLIERFVELFPFLDFLFCLGNFLGVGR
ncbi:hypothetical protein FHS26_003653 [Rhizobium pisi]|uniref:Uncharacterized protein n=1 Tax=Rhizobium pisi TaxID=574561 RepID=A0A427MX98_9HYPH|nr:hypothetical protein [Rhizobium pisi]MBB3135906.1 hypothetical protein [Rhizobium pisi]RSB75780.1 hypothetical protein EFD55_18300 [Rhizobium pisi]TCA49377.1 hypothetical protein E0J16_24065 [Rhizobium pisi]